jgi:hypothetical protein
MKWRDKRNVAMISTYHGTEMKSETKRGKEKQKPVCVIDYNKCMGGIDLKDQLLQMHLVERKRMHKWYMKLFRRLLNATVLNAMIIYRHNTGKQIDQLAFRINLVEGLFEQFAGRWKTPFRDCGKGILFTKFLHLEKNQHHRGGAWYAPNTEGGKNQDVAVCSVTSDCVWRNVLKPITQNLISKVI